MSKISDKFWSKVYSYQQSNRYDNERNIKEDRKLVKIVNSIDKKDTTKVFSSLYGLFKEKL